MNLLKNAGQALAAIAPTLATAAGGPLAGLAVSSLEKVFGIDPASSPQAKEQAINQALAQMTPEQVVALKKAEQDFQVQMKQLDISEESLTYQDIASARAREIAVKDYTPTLLALGITLGFFGVLGYMIGVGKPKEGGDALLVMLGSLGTAWAGVISYYFGSSIGAQKNAQTIAEIAKS